MDTSQKVTGWIVRVMYEDSRKEAAQKWRLATAGNDTLRDNCTAIDIEHEAE